MSQPPNPYGRRTREKLGDANNERRVRKRGTGPSFVKTSISLSSAGIGYIVDRISSSQFHSFAVSRSVNARPHFEDQRRALTRAMVPIGRLAFRVG